MEKHKNNNRGGRGMIEKLKKITVKTTQTEDKVVRNQRSQCRTTHKRQDC